MLHPAFAETRGGARSSIPQAENVTTGSQEQPWGIGSHAPRPCGQTGGGFGRMIFGSPFPRLLVEAFSNERQRSPLGPRGAHARGRSPHRSLPPRRHRALGMDRGPSARDGGRRVLPGLPDLSLEHLSTTRRLRQRARSALKAFHARTARGACGSCRRTVVPGEGFEPPTY